jgi:hypothetical protein
MKRYKKIVFYASNLIPYDNKKLVRFFEHIGYRNVKIFTDVDIGEDGSSLNDRINNVKLELTEYKSTIETLRQNINNLTEVVGDITRLYNECNK